MKEKGPQSPPSGRDRNQRPREIQCGRKVSEDITQRYNIIWRVKACEKRNYTVGKIEINCDKRQEDWKKEASAETRSRSIPATRDLTDTGQRSLIRGRSTLGEVLTQVFHLSPVLTGSLILKVPHGRGIAIFARQTFFPNKAVCHWKT